MSGLFEVFDKKGYSAPDSLFSPIFIRLYGPNGTKKRDKHSHLKSSEAKRTKGNHSAALLIQPMEKLKRYAVYDTRTNTLTIEKFHKKFAK